MEFYKLIITDLINKDATTGKNLCCTKNFFSELLQHESV